MPGNERAAVPEKRKEPAATVQWRTGSHTKCSTPQHSKPRRGPQGARPQLELCVGLRFVQRTRNGRTHRYEVVAVEPYVRVRDGKTIRLYTIRGRCAKCDAPFLGKAGRREPRFLTRHCERHRTRGHGHG